MQIALTALNLVPEKKLGPEIKVKILTVGLVAEAMCWVGCGGYVLAGWVMENSTHSATTHRFFPQVRVWQKHASFS